MAGWVPWIDPEDHHRRPEALEPDLCVDGPRAPVWSGLYGPDGERLYRLPEPLGFHNPKG